MTTVTGANYYLHILYPEITPYVKLQTWKFLHESIRKCNGNILKPICLKHWPFIVSVLSLHLVSSQMITSLFLYNGYWKLLTKRWKYLSAPQAKKVNSFWCRSRFHIFIAFLSYSTYFNGGKIIWHIFIMCVLMHYPSIHKISNAAYPFQGGGGDGGTTWTGRRPITEHAYIQTNGLFLCMGTSATVFKWSLHTIFPFHCRKKGANVFWCWTIQ